MRPMTVTSSFLACTILFSFFILQSQCNPHQDEEGSKKVVVDDDLLLLQIDVLLEWLDDEDGFLDPRLEIRRAGDSSNTSRMGIFVKESIQANEVLMEIPGEIKIQLDDNMMMPIEEEEEDESEDDEEEEEEDDNDNQINYPENICQLAWSLRDEFDDGQHSDYYPYIQYLQLLSQQQEQQVPAMYSPAGQHVILQIAIRIEFGLWPSDNVVMWPWTLYEEFCMQENDGNSLSPYFITLAVQRGLERAFIPIYDLIMHHSDQRKINIFTNTSILLEENDGNSNFQVYALKDLEPGDELFRSYRDCPDCPTQFNYLGTPEILRNYGFVEPYPHTFHFADDTTVIVDDDDDMGGEEEDNYVATCENDKCPSKELVEELIHELKETEYMVQASEPIMKKSEYETIKAYYKALTVAFTTVLPQCGEYDDPAEKVGNEPISETELDDQRDEL